MLISLASSQYSPRVVHGLFRDPFNKQIMGIVIGTFTYCLVVLRAVRGPLEESGQAVVPSISLMLAVVLGVVSVLSIVAFISHSAHLMDVSKILHRVTDEALEQIRTSWSESPPEVDDSDMSRPTEAGFAVTFDRQGWIQQIDHRALLDTMQPGSRMEVETVAGRYAIPNIVLGTVWPRPADEDAAREAMRAAVVVGETRTMQQDVTYGIRQLADVALKALSPGINDPTTAQDAMFHLGAVLQELLVRNPPARRLDGDGDRVLLLPEAITHEDLVGLAFDEVRVASATQPTVQIYLLELVHLLSESLDSRDRVEAQTALRRQADLVVEGGEFAELSPYDQERVASAYRNRFGTPGYA